MSCKQFADFLGEYFAGELSDQQRAIFDRHMALCPDCRNYLESYFQTVALEEQLRAHEAEEVPPEVPEDLVAAILASRGS